MSDKYIVVERHINERSLGCQALVTGDVVSHPGVMIELVSARPSNAVVDSHGPPGFNRDPRGLFWVIDVLVDFIFIADVCLAFRTTAVDPVTKETITDVREISAR